MQWISNKDNIDYENKEKSRELLQSIGNQYSKERATPDNLNVAQNDKVVKQKINPESFPERFRLYHIPKTEGRLVKRKAELVRPGKSNNQLRLVRSCATGSDS